MRMPNDDDKSMKEVPEHTKEFLTGVNIFSTNHDEVLPQEPLGPFICSPDIKFNEYELKILSRGPKFMVRQDLSKEEYSVDIEKMIVKKKFNRMFNEFEDDSCEST